MAQGRGSGGIPLIYGAFDFSEGFLVKSLAKSIKPKKFVISVAIAHCHAAIY